MKLFIKREFIVFTKDTPGKIMLIPSSKLTGQVGEVVFINVNKTLNKIKKLM